jgi:hypothetical protein
MRSWLESELRPDGGAERRSTSRDDTLSALDALLDGIRRDGAFEAVALADAAGVLVAGAGAFRTCEEIAALSPLVARAGAANDTVPTRLDVLARKMEVRRLRIDGIEVLVSGQGGDPTALGRAASGCARILQTRRG